MKAPDGRQKKGLPEGSPLNFMFYLLLKYVCEVYVDFAVEVIATEEMVNKSVSSHYTDDWVERLLFSSLANHNWYVRTVNYTTVSSTRPFVTYSDIVASRESISVYGESILDGTNLSDTRRKLHWATACRLNQEVVK